MPSVVLACAAALLAGGVLIADDQEDPIEPTPGSTSSVTVGNAQVDPGDAQGLEIDVKDSLDVAVIADGTMAVSGSASDGIPESDPLDGALAPGLAGVQ